MAGTVVFVQGVGNGAHEADKRLADSLASALGPRFDLRYPVMPHEDDAVYEQWREKIEQTLSDLPAPISIVGHSVGASIVLKLLSQREESRAIAGVFLIACPFWGGDGWRYEGYEKLELPPNFASKPSPDLPIYVYHCRDDATVPFEHLALYTQLLPQASAHAFDKGGHQFGDDLSAVARDIAALG